MCHMDAILLTRAPVCMVCVCVCVCVCACVRARACLECAKELSLCVPVLLGSQLRGLDFGVSGAQLLA